MITADRMTAWKPIAFFVAFACGIAWIIWLPLLLGPAGLRITHSNAFLPLFVSLGTIGPLSASFLAVRYESGEWGLPSRLLPPNWLRYWLNLLTGPILVILAFVVIPYMICVQPGYKLISLTFLTPLRRVWPNILGGPLEEEFGWRGFLMPRLTSLVGQTWATLIVGVVWASWHLPLIACHVYEGLSFSYYLPLVVALSVFASVAYFTTGRSILGAIILHYVFNTCSFMLAKAFEGKQYYPNRDWQQVYLCSMIAVALLIVAITKGKLGDSNAQVRRNALRPA
jgi:membrane protease YdiL (CAAX protease family)